MTLDQLSAAATQGAFEAQAPDVENDFGVPIIATNYPGTYGPSNGLVLWATMLPTEIGDKDTRRAQANTAFVVALVNAYRTGQLVAVTDDAIERVARTLAPNLEGGREFDQMPKDRVQLRQWTAQGMCLINDATQDDATWLAQEAIKAAKGTGHE